jgi:biopolymer transport protein ExbB/TolQ
MSLVNLSTFLFYALMLWLLGRAVCHALTVMAARRDVLGALESFDSCLQRYLFGATVLVGADRQALESNAAKRRALLPAAEILLIALSRPRWCRDESRIAFFIENYLSARFGELRRAMQFNRRIGPTVGLLGSIFGLSLSAWQYASTGDPGTLFLGIAVALITSLIGGLISIAERWATDTRLEPLAESLSRQAFRVVHELRGIELRGIDVEYGESLAYGATPLEESDEEEGEDDQPQGGERCSPPR